MFVIMSVDTVVRSSQVQKRTIFNEKLVFEVSASRSVIQVNDPPKKWTNLSS